MPIPIWQQMVGRHSIKQQQTPFDLIITDVDMPKMNASISADPCMTTRQPAISPSIIVSTFDSDKDIEKGFEAGASAYLSKKDVGPLLNKTISEVLWKTTHVRRRKISIVEDSPSILALVGRMLTLNGFNAVSASDGKIALDLLATEKPDLILSDINMPEVDGFELCKAVKANPELAAIPFVVMSSNDDKVHMNRMIQYGAASYLVKPFNLNQLVMLIERILSDHFLLLLKDRERLDYERKSLLDSITSLISAL